MSPKSPVRAADLRGVSRLAIDAVTGLTDLVEAMHHNIGSASSMVGIAPKGRTSGITGMVYGSIRGVTRMVGGGLDSLLARLNSLLGEGASPPTREALIAVLNGVLGDYLVATGNPLAIPMTLRLDGRPLNLATGRMNAVAVRARAHPGKLLILVHGLCMSDQQWTRHGHDHGAALARDLGYTPLYLHYNSGLHVSTNGREFASMLEALVHAWPVPVTDLTIVGHSMGGLVARSACHFGHAAGHTWPRVLRHLIFLGTPHHGAPLERGGNWVDLLLSVSPYSAPLARLGKIRSAGVTDLRYGLLLDEDWEGRDRFARRRDARTPVPLPAGVGCYAIAVTTGAAAGDARDRMLGDGLVPLASALGRHPKPERALPIPEENQWVRYGMNHLDLLSSPEVYAQIRRWLEAAQRKG